MPILTASNDNIAYKENVRDINIKNVDDELLNSFIRLE